MRIGRKKLPAKYRLSVILDREEYNRFAAFLDARGGIPMSRFARSLILQAMSQKLSGQETILAQAMKEAQT